ncbi:MAG TPA: TIGR03862 family flavoprotein [Acidimicrobiales bacterium]|nr:TIGR03862 family flavoprotein [Acidimicrobiales bacterium]
MGDQRVHTKLVSVVGGGPAGLMAAEVLATAGVRVVVREQKAAVGRKFLLAGRGGLNLTHTESLGAFLDRYGAARPRLAAAIEAFGPGELRAWAAGLGEEPFVGTSGRVFPAGFRATPLLRNWLARLRELGVEIRVRDRWTGFDDPSAADATILALGGASWPTTGSDGAWVGALQRAGIAVTPLQPANCGFAVAWSDVFRDRFAGQPLKNVALSVGDRASARGDAMITRDGIEGGPVYALSASLRDALAGGAASTLYVDLMPDVTCDALTSRLARRRAGDSAASWLRRGGFSPVAIGLLREASSNQLSADASLVAQLAKRLPVRVIAPQPLARAISTAGGVAFDDVDDAFMLRRRPGAFVAGEMLDWEAPTGGYLLQATFSTAVAAARGALAWLA